MYHANTNFKKRSSYIIPIMQALKQGNLSRIKKGALHIDKWVSSPGRHNNSYLVCA